MIRPNILLILADDLGYGDLGCYGNRMNDTPNLDALAVSGCRFTDFHACAAWCVPSRAGLMTGCHPYRADMLPWGQTRFPVRSMASMLKEAGYSTGLIGKWHLGMDEGHHPLDQGFDYYYGTPSSNDTPAPSRWKHNYELFRTCEKDTFPIDLIRMRDVIECPADQELFIQRYTAEAGRFISAQMNTPFFLYLAHNAPHVPVFPSEAFRGTSRSGRYGDVVRELDWSVGQLVALLAHEGILENTLVLFTSDNGPWTMFWEFGGTAWPLRGEKATAWEGGTRVPAIASMPGSIDSGVSSEFVVSLDLYATFARLAGVSIDRGVAVDSLDMHDVLFHRAASPRTSYLYCAYDRPFSYRSGDHKVHLRSIERMRDPHTCEPSRVTEYETPLVFDVRHDISEKRDLSGSRADTRDRLVQEARVASRALGSECR